MILAPYNPAWASEFEAIQDVYLGALGTLAICIEHVGSTAVPHLRAKPILDIDIVIPSYEVFADVIGCLRKLGYTHNGDQGIREREAFKELDPTAPYTSPRRPWMLHHLYVCPAHSVELRRHLLFRDALRTSPDLRQEYERLKVGIAERVGDDRKAYARIKEVECRAFVEGVLKHALGGLGSCV